MLAKLICRRYDTPFGSFSVQSLMVGDFRKEVCQEFSGWFHSLLGEMAEPEIDAERLWRELPSPCWMIWFLLMLAGNKNDEALVAELRQLARKLNVDSFGDTVDPEKCRLVREAFQWERVRQLLGCQPTPSSLRRATLAD